MNRSDLLGNLGATPVLRHTTNGTSVCDLRVATNKRWTNSKGEKKVDTQWHRVVVWGKQAENCCKFLTKGRSIRVCGETRTNEWEDKNGVVRQTSEVHASEVVFLPDSRYSVVPDEATQPEETPEILDHRDKRF